MKSFSFARALLVAGVTVALLDGVYASVSGQLRGGSAQGVWKFVASGAVGRGAFKGGAEMVLLGLCFHVLVAFTVSAIYLCAARRWEVLRQHWVGAGLVYGVLVHVVMLFCVIPLSAAPPLQPTVKSFLLGLIPHLFCVGLPIGWVASRVGPKAVR